MRKFSQFSIIFRIVDNYMTFGRVSILFWFPAMANYISKIGCISIKIGKASLELLEAFNIPELTREKVLDEIKREFNLDGLIYVATCNRVEFIMLMPEGAEISNIRNAMLDNFLKDRPAKFKNRLEPDCFRLYRGRDAIRHVFRVAASLDSVVIGESQILGQLKDAHRFALSAGLSDPILDRIMMAAFKAAKQVRTETDLGKKPVSMASLVMQKIDQLLYESPQMSIAVVGSGPMTTKLAQIIRKRHNNQIYFINRTLSKVERIAEQFQGKAVHLNDYVSGRVRADIVVSSTSSEQPLFDAGNIDKLVPDGGKMYAFDMAIPRDFAANLLDHEAVKVWDLEGLNEISRQNRRERFRTADTANRIIEQQVINYIKKEIANMISPFFHSSLTETNEMADNSLEDLFKKKLSHLNENDQKLLKYWSQKLVNKACFTPARLLAEQIVEADLEDNLELTSLFENRDQSAAS